MPRGNDIWDITFGQIQAWNAKGCFCDIFS